MPVEAISVAEPLWFDGHQGETHPCLVLPPQQQPTQGLRHCW